MSPELEFVYDEDALLAKVITGADGEWDEFDLRVESEDGEPLDDTKQRRHISPYVRHKLMVKHGFRCAYCGTERELQIDHILPVSKGGDNEEKNLQVLCRRCNQEKFTFAKPKWLK